MLAAGSRETDEGGSAGRSSAGHGVEKRKQKRDTARYEAVESYDMIEHRSLPTLGSTDLGWLNAVHHFCFARYQDPDRMEWGRLRVLNYNRLAPGASIQPSFHYNIEIIILIHVGQIVVDSGSNGRHLLSAGEVMVIGAGVGIEYGVTNPGNLAADYTEIWIIAEESSQTPTLNHRKANYSSAETILASGLVDDRAAVLIQATARLRVLELAHGTTLRCFLRTRRAYLAMLRGAALCDDRVVSRHDALAVLDEPMVDIEATDDSTLLLIEMG